MPSWLSTLLVPFILKALTGLTGAVKWDQIIATVVSDLTSSGLPTWLIGLLTPFVQKVASIFQAALADTADEAKVVTDLAAGNYAQALADIEALVVKAYQGGTAALMGDPVAHSVAAACGELAKHAATLGGAAA